VMRAPLDKNPIGQLARAIGRRYREIDGERGGVIIEVLVSSILLVITAVGVFSAFDAGARSTAEQRHRSRAEGIAQADLARMRTMKISDLSNLHETKSVTIEETDYTVVSSAEFQTDETGTATCDESKAKADYIQIRSTITWPSIGERPPIVAQSLVAPPNGSISTESGALAVQVVNAKDVGIEGVGLTGTGAGSFNGVTGPNGCAIFGNLPDGEYTLTLSGPTLVDGDGKPPAPETTSVVAESTNTLVLQYDAPGQIEASFETRVGGELVPSSADAVVLFNSGMELPKAFGEPGAPQATVTATPLFPFASPYAIYAGTCGGNDPGQEGVAAPPGTVAEGVVSANGSTKVTIELPALHLTAWDGDGAASPGEPVAGAEVLIIDTKCEPGNPVVRTATTDASGALPDPGLPFSTYEVCVSDGAKRVTAVEVAVPFDPEDMAAGTELDAYLNHPSAEAGKCQ
jgi:Tfp pilus assembly protein PilV